MNNLLKQKSSILLCVIFLSFASVLNTGCSKDNDDDKEDGCSNFTTIDGSIEINGKTLKLSVAQNLISAGGSSFGDSYIFQLAGISDNCNEVHTVNVTINIPSGSKLQGTYPLKDFFDADIGDATGTYSLQTITPTSQSLIDFTSGAVTVTDAGTKLYTINLDGTLVGGGNIALKITKQF